MVFIYQATPLHPIRHVVRHVAEQVPSQEYKHVLVHRPSQVVLHVVSQDPLHVVLHPPLHPEEQPLPHEELQPDEQPLPHEELQPDEHPLQPPLELPLQVEVHAVLQVLLHVEEQSEHDDGSVNGSLSQLVRNGIPLPIATKPKIGITFFVALLKNSLLDRSPSSLSFFSIIVILSLLYELFVTIFHKKWICNNIHFSYSSITYAIPKQAIKLSPNKTLSLISSNAELDNCQTFVTIKIMDLDTSDCHEVLLPPYHCHFNL